MSLKSIKSSDGAANTLFTIQVRMPPTPHPTHPPTLSGEGERSHAPTPPHPTHPPTPPTFPPSPSPTPPLSRHQSRSSVFDPATSRLHLKNVMPVVLFTQGDTTGRLHAADFYAHVKGAADVLVEGDRNGTVDRAVYRISDPKYDNLTNSVDFKAAARGVKDAPILKGGMVGAAIAGPDAEKGLVKPVAANEAGRPQSLVNTVVFVDAKAAEVGGKKGGKCEAWGCALGGDK